ncbi:MAG: Holliday junction resolvase RuvX [Thermomicrobiaceae bacterium]
MNQQLQHGRRVALDVGGRRVGLAVSDELSMVASPVRAVDIKHEGIAGLARIIMTYDPVEVVVGLPTGMSGFEGPQARETRDFAARLAEHVPVPISYWDERLTTFAADQALVESGYRAQRRKKMVDAVAASLILQSYLDSKR